MQERIITSFGYCWILSEARVADYWPAETRISPSLVFAGGKSCLIPKRDPAVSKWAMNKFHLLPVHLEGVRYRMES
jgi:hypothetical protein